MNCPGCGKLIAADENFCRDCGRALTLRPPLGRLQIAGLAVIAMMFVGLMVAIGGKMFEMKWMAYLGLAVMMSGAFIIAAYGFLRETRPRRQAVNANGVASHEPIEKASTTSKLLPPTDSDYIPSVIESTTELLETPAGRTST